MLEANKREILRGRVLDRRSKFPTDGDTIVDGQVRELQAVRLHVVEPVRIRDRQYSLDERREARLFIVRCKQTLTLHGRQQNNNPETIWFWGFFCCRKKSMRAFRRVGKGDM